MPVKKHTVEQIIAKLREGSGDLEPDEDLQRLVTLVEDLADGAEETAVAPAVEGV